MPTSFFLPLLLLLLLPLLTAAGDFDSLLTQLGPATPPRTWEESYSLATTLVEKLTTAEKISLTTGTGIALGPCSGNVQHVARVG